MAAVPAERHLTRASVAFAASSSDATCLWPHPCLHANAHAHVRVKNVFAQAQGHAPLSSHAMCTSELYSSKLAVQIANKAPAAKTKFVYSLSFLPVGLQRMSA